MEKRFEYIIKVEGKEVWRGLNPKDKYFEIKKKNPNKKVSVAWHTDEDILVCIIL